jgi:hypothetical protein
MRANQIVETSKLDLVEGGDRKLPVQQGGTIALSASAVGALAVGALAVGALAIGRLAIGQIALGRAALRSSDVGELRITRLALPT